MEIDMQNIIVLDDEKEIADLLEVYLTNEGYQVFKFYRAKGVLDCIQENEISLAILDVMLPDIDGFQLCRQIRENWYFPIIMLTAKVEDVDKITGLTVGADDYITKPFDIKEVVARVQIQLRHAGREQAPDRISCGEISLDKVTHQIRIGGKELEHLTRQEFAILELLLEHPGQVFSKEAIFTYAWQEEYMGETKTLDVHISNIRKKLKSLTDKEYIQTVWGIGYRLQPSK